MAGGRQVSLTVEGGELELDQSILEKLRSPLLQLVRNAVDHGIEAADVREAAGKAPEGRIVVSAVIEGNRVQVCVADDGRGLDLAAVADRKIGRASCRERVCKSVEIHGVAVSLKKK